MEENGIKVNTNIDTKKENEFNEKQNKIKEMLNYKYVAIKGALICLMINANDDIVIQTYLNIFQNYISIFAAVNLTFQPLCPPTTACEVIVNCCVNKAYEILNVNTATNKTTNKIFLVLVFFSTIFASYC